MPHLHLQMFWWETGIFLNLAKGVLKVYGEHMYQKTFWA